MKDDDEEQIRQLLAGRPGAQEAFVRRYEGLILGLAKGRFAFGEEAARDLLQQVVKRLWEHDCRALRSWRRKGSFASYLTVIVCHACLRERERSRSREQSLEESLESEYSVPAQLVAPGPSASDRLARQEQRAAVRDALQQLSSRDRLLLALRFEDERSPKDIAAALGLRPGTARKAIHDALERLKNHARARQPELFGMPFLVTRGTAEGPEGERG